jgi:hypothetical protein
MAHFAKLDENNKVIHVSKVKDNECVDADGVETDEQGQNFLRFVRKEPNAVWKRCSYNTTFGNHSIDQSKAFRGNFPSINYTYDETLDIFVPPKPYPSWVLYTGEDTDQIRKYSWQPPVVYVGNPDGTNTPYYSTWDELQGTWTAYMANDNETQYIWNNETSAWETV